MATRHLRRLKGSEDLLPTVPSSPDDPEESDGRSSEEGEGGVTLNDRHKAFNPYAFLAELDEEDGDKEESDDPPESTSADADGNSGDVSEKQACEIKKEVKKAQPVKPPEETNNPVKKKKRKKKRKGKGNPGVSAIEEDEEDVDKLIAELNLQTVGMTSARVQTSSAASSSRKAGQSNVLGVTSGSLRADEELYRIFGAQVVASEEAQMQREKDRRSARHPKGVRGMRKQNKTFWLVDVQDHWPPKDGGLNMEYEGSKDGSHWFTYSQNSNYERVQSMFEECQSTGNPAALQVLLQKNPWHVDSLLAMHDFYRLTGEHMQAEEMLHRCLYALETAWHPFFSVTLGTCKLDIKVPTNKTFFRALFRHTQNLCRRGCIATGLECCKLLLSLDEGDPMGALCLIDYLAIRAGRFDFLQRLVDEVDNGSSFALMPGISFSIALSKFKKSSELQKPRAGSTSKARLQSGSDGCESEDGNHDAKEDANDSLLEAILLYPVVIRRLLAKLKDKSIQLDAGLGLVLSRRLFSTADEGGSASLSHLVDIFVERNHLLWKSSEVLQWLKAGCEAAAASFDGTGSDSTADDWACVRGQAFPSSDVNEYRHLHLYDFSDDAAQLSQQELQRLMGDGGVQGGLAEGEDIMMEEVLQRLDEIQRVMQRREEVAEMGPFLAFLRSLLPWNQLGEAPNDNQQRPNEGNEPH